MLNSTQVVVVVEVRVELGNKANTLYIDRVHSRLQEICASISALEGVAKNWKYWKNFYRKDQIIAIMIQEIDYLICRVIELEEITEHEAAFKYWISKFIKIIDLAQPTS